MKERNIEEKVVVYHSHLYYFYDKGEKVFLDWGETGFIPNEGDFFLHPEKEKDIELEAIYES